MLKRYQVLLNDWMASHVQNISDMYDISFSETIRGALCLSYLSLIIKDYPACRIDLKNIYERSSLKKGNYEKVGREQFHKDMSKLYFEARKAIDFFWNEEEKRNKKKSKRI